MPTAKGNQSKQPVLWGLSGLQLGLLVVLGGLALVTAAVGGTLVLAGQLVAVLPADVTATIMAASEKALGTVLDVGKN